MVTTDHHKKKKNQKTEKPKNQKTEKLRKEKLDIILMTIPCLVLWILAMKNDWFACGWIYIGFVSFLFLFFVSGILSSERVFFFQ